MRKKQRICKTFLSLVLALLMVFSITAEPVMVMAVGSSSGIVQTDGEINGQPDGGNIERIGTEELYSIAGTVICGDSPVSGVSIKIDGEVKATTGQDGKYEVEVEKGSHELTATKQGFEEEQIQNINISDTSIEQGIELELAKPIIELTGETIVDSSIIYSIENFDKDIYYTWDFSEEPVSEEPVLKILEDNSKTVKATVCNSGTVTATVTAQYGTTNSISEQESTMEVKTPTISLVVTENSSKDGIVTSVKLTATVEASQGGGTVTFKATEGADYGCFEEDKTSVELSNGQATCVYSAKNDNGSEGFGAELKFQAVYSGVTGKYAEVTAESEKNEYKASKPLSWAEKDVYGQTVETVEEGEVPTVHIEYGRRYDENVTGNYEIPIDKTATGYGDNYTYELLDENDQPIQDTANAPITIDNEGIVTTKRASNEGEKVRVKITRTASGYVDAEIKLDIIVDKRKIILENEPSFEGKKIYDNSTKFENIEFAVSDLSDLKFGRGDSEDKCEDALLENDKNKLKSFIFRGTGDTDNEDVEIYELMVNKEDINSIELVDANGNTNNNYEVTIPDEVKICLEILPAEYKIRIKDAERAYGTKDYTTSPQLDLDSIPEADEADREAIKKAIELIDASQISSPMTDSEYAKENKIEGDYISAEIKENIAGNYKLVIDSDSKGKLKITREVIDNPLNGYVELGGISTQSNGDGNDDVRFWLQRDSEGTISGTIQITPEASSKYNEVKITEVKVNGEKVNFSSQSGKPATIKFNNVEEGKIITDVAIEYRLENKIQENNKSYVAADTDNFELCVNIDSEAPTARITEPEDAKLTMTTVEELARILTFGAYAKGTYYITAEVDDGEGAGVKNWSYAVTDLPQNSDVDWTQFIEGIEEWTSCSGTSEKIEVFKYDGAPEEANTVLENKLVLVNVTDNVGNSKTYLSNGIVIDNFKPDICLDYIADVYASKDLNEQGEVTFNVIVNDKKHPEDNEKATAGIQGVAYKLYDGETDITNHLAVAESTGENQVCTIKDVSEINSNNLALKVKAIDKAGNESEATKQFKIDTEAPKIQINKGIDNLYSSDSVEINVIFNDLNFSDINTKLHVSINNSPEEVIPFNEKNDTISIDRQSSTQTEVTYKLTFKDEGDYKVWIESTDCYGNGPTETETEKLEFIIDKTAPQITWAISDDIDNPVQNGQYFQKSRTAEFTVTERNMDAEEIRIVVNAWNLKGESKQYTYTLQELQEAEKKDPFITASIVSDSGRPVSGDRQVKIKFEFAGDASYKIESIYCKDCAGLSVEGTSQSGQVVQGIAALEFTVDKTAPAGEIFLTVRNSDKWYQVVNNIYFNLFSNQNETATVSGSDATSGVKTIQYTVLRDGLTQDNLTAMDNAGQIEWTTHAYKEKISDESVNKLLSPNRQCVVYAKITDYAEHVTYLSSNGFILDNVSPSVNITVLNPGDADNGIFNEDVQLRIDVQDQEVNGAHAGLKEVGYSIEAAGNINASGGETWSVDGDYTFSKIITVDADTYNSNDVKVTAYAVDRAENRGSTDAATELKIDVTAPTISVVWDLNDPSNGRYYKDTRTATVTITDRNFDADRVEFSITNTDGVSASIGGWSVSGDMGVSDSATATCQVAFPEDGDYTFTLNCTDLAGNSGTYGQTDEFTIDKTVPMITVTYDNNDAQHGNYYKEARTATVTVNEHNFDAASVQAAITASLEGQGIAAPSLSGFSGSGDVHTATVEYDTDGDYTFDIEYTDLAGNTAEDYAEDRFTVDLTAPEVNIFDIVDQSANKDSVAPGVEYTDINYDADGVDITLTGANSGAASVGSSVTTIDNGQRIKYNDFARTEEMDDLYTLTAKITDLAGNVTEKTVRFSVNRYGSVFVLDDASDDWLHEGGVEYRYANQETEIGVMEINVDEIDEYSIAVTRDGDLKKLEEGSEFTVTNSRNEATWRVNYYHINEENFAQEGNYDVTITSTDSAANSVNNQTVKKSDGALPIKFTIDKTAPTVVVSGIEDGGRYMADSRNIMLDVKDNLALDTVSITIGDGETEVIQAEDIRAEDGIISRKIPSSDRYQTIRITATDAAGNVLGQEEPGDEGVDIVMSVLVTSNVMIQFFMNKPLFYGTIIGLLALILLIVILIKRKKKQDQVV